LQIGGSSVDHLSVAETRKEARRQRWYVLLRSYGEETTLHGLRYIIEPTNLLCRR